METIAGCDRLPPIEFSSLNGRELTRPVYHFRALWKVRLLVRAGSKQRRGATEHYYRLSGDVRD